MISSNAIRLTLVAGICFVSSSLLSGQSLSLEKVGDPPDQTWDNRKESIIVDLETFLDVPGVSGDLVILDTDLGAITFEMLPGSAPLTVTNFLGYVERDQFDATFFHRSIPGFIIQAGGFTYEIPVGSVVQGDPVVNEFNLSNVRGTVAMAKLGDDPNSATSGWFINLSNNIDNLDTQNGGFTVFARVIGTGMDVVDAIAGIDRYNYGGAFQDLPLQGVLGETLILENLVLENFVALSTAEKSTVFPAQGGVSSFVSYSANTSSDTAIAATSIDGSLLTVALGVGQVGSSDIAVTVEDVNGNQVQLNFAVTLEDAFVTFDESSKALAFDTASFDIAIQSNTRWVASADSDWISVSQAEGDGPETVTISLAQNAGIMPRVGQVTIDGKSKSVVQYGSFDTWLADSFSSEEIAAMQPSASEADMDGDGLSNGEEHLLHTDPASTTSKIKVSVVREGVMNTVRVWPYLESLEYTMESSDALSIWVPEDMAEGMVETDSETLEKSLLFEFTEEGSAFYRALVALPVLE